MSVARTNRIGACGVRSVVSWPVPWAVRTSVQCTPSRLTTWVDCPRHYRMKYLDRPRPSPGPPWAHNSLGASVHNALAGWWRLASKARTPDAAGRLLDAGWLTDGFRDERQSASWRERAREMVRRYTAALDPLREPIGVERTLGARTRRLALSGRVDRLDDRDGELVVVDYKTGRRPPTVDDARGSAALALYAVAAGATLRRPCHEVELHHVPTGEVVTPDIRDAERLQGFPEDWTSPAETVARASLRWSLVGNAVSVPVAAWLGERLATHGTYDDARDVALPSAGSWPKAARFDGERRSGVAINAYPVWQARANLVEFLRYPGKPLSARATRGFLSRTERAKLRFAEGFQDRLRDHLRRMDGETLEPEFAIAAE